MSSSAAAKGRARAAPGEQTPWRSRPQPRRSTTPSAASDPFAFALRAQRGIGADDFNAIRAVALAAAGYRTHPFATYDEFAHDGISCPAARAKDHVTNGARPQGILIPDGTQPSAALHLLGRYHIEVAVGAEAIVRTRWMRSLPATGEVTGCWARGGWCRPQHR